MSDTVQSVTRTVPVQADALWAVLIDPGRHQGFDGSGMVRGTTTPDQITKVGDVFRMNMSHPAFGEYQMDNQVRELVPGRRIAWAPGQADKAPMGHLWIWELRPDGDGTTVTHTCDWSEVPEAVRSAIPFPVVSAEQMQASIDQLARLAAS